ncbi:hypothetical protein JSR06_00590 [Candidatus Vidania fulgoroideae]|uniref:tRNA-specific 2-thiouridylase MnmA-like C-terminal domain-containing protein n=1 Tax=Candidatus Vidania fulgoroideorum TaxID=881286 RepID=A0A974X7M4_9PROT|nr:hypothetical protein JSR06_00590 [Candidatus Vidania fulgoroideae]
MCEVYILFSGGIDSTFACFILKKLNVKFICVYIKICIYKKKESISNEINNCISLSSFLNSNFSIVDKTEEYKNKIYKKLIKEYLAGKTINPDVLCNREIKFGSVFRMLIKRENFTFITGHYARKKEGKVLISKDFKKDQTYFIFNIRNIKQVIFLMGEFIKREVIYIGSKIFFYRINAQSRGICFLEISKFRSFIGMFIKKKNTLETVNGIIKGKNCASLHLTIGQRVNYCLGRKNYIVKKQGNKMIITSNKDSIYLKKRTFIIIKYYNREEKTNIKLLLLGKTSSQSKLNKCFLIRLKERYKIVFVYPIRKVSPGQYIVIYKGNICYGGGMVK